MPNSTSSTQAIHIPLPKGIKLIKRFPPLSLRLILVSSNLLRQGLKNRLLAPHATHPTLLFSQQHEYQNPHTNTTVISIVAPGRKGQSIVFLVYRNIPRLTTSRRRVLVNIHGVYNCLSAGDIIYGKLSPLITTRREGRRPTPLLPGASPFPSPLRL